MTQEMTFEEFARKYCERQNSEPPFLRDTLLNQKKAFKCDGWVLLECAMLDSSYLGSLTILPYGPNNTLKAVPNRAVSPRGLASDMSVVVGILPADKLQPHQMTKDELFQLVEKREKYAKELNERARAQPKSKFSRSLKTTATQILADCMIAYDILKEEIPINEKEEKVKTALLKSII